MNSNPVKNLPQELRSMVKWSVSIFGQVVHEELGNRGFQRIEKTRKKMAGLRGKPHDLVFRELEKVHGQLSVLSAKEKFEFAKAYTLMLELMNACENAYRTRRLKLRNKPIQALGAEAIYFVLTAHPTEARSPENIHVFNEIQKLLVRAFESGTHEHEKRLRALLELAWKVEIVRLRKPRVQDEADSVYSILLRDSNLSTLLDFGSDYSPVYIRSWVGGDKDGHPGVNAKVMSDSLQLSRKLILKYLFSQLAEAKKVIEQLNIDGLMIKHRKVIRSASQIRNLKSGDGTRLKQLHEAILEFVGEYQEKVGFHLPDPLNRIQQLIKIFPGVVVPLELREDSAVLMSDPTGKKIAIAKMLKKISDFSDDQDPTLYVRGLIISMTQNAEQVMTGVRLVRACTGNQKIPVVPLFEQKNALNQAPTIVETLLKNQPFKKMIQKEWSGIFEVMVGYSDSAKESGVLPSRLSILESINSVESSCRDNGIKAVFFHGSGGSVDRGGGAVKDQIAGWPPNTLDVYKATVQGEMIDRTFSSPEILKSQLSQIIEMTERRKGRIRSMGNHRALESFASMVRNEYQKMIQDEGFLELVQLATPYAYLNALKIGSRPSKRSKGELKVSSLRAIPWVLCWTQTRILFPTWWGLGSAWKQTSAENRKALKKLFSSHGVFRSFVHALGFTLAKIELPIFEYYLKNSNLDPKLRLRLIAAFKKELVLTHQCFYQITNQKNPLWFRPWLGESIELRAPMIHPLNILENIARKDRDLKLLRVTVTGIASGMLTTG